MSWLSAAWSRNKGAIASLATHVVRGDLIGAGQELAQDAVGEAKRVIARTNAPPEAQAMMLAQATNGINAAAASAGVNQPSALNPLGAQGSQVVAIGGRTVSVNTLALIGLGLVLLVVVFFVARKRH